jgi:endonuclease/exonuclease/phosphatase family metal-dependent hydrolase
MKRSLVIVLVVSVVLSGCRSDPAPHAYNSSLTAAERQACIPEEHYQRMAVGAWNLYWFGSPQRRSKPAVPKDHSAMARYIRSADVAVLALMEIRADPNGSNAELASLLGGMPGRWQYRLFGQFEGNDENTGVAWDASRLTLRRTIELKVNRHPAAWDRFAKARERTDSDGRPAPIHNRRVFAALFSAGEGRTDFAVIPLHLIATGDDLYVSRVRRYFEMATIVDRVARDVLARGEHDVILIGDTNCAADRFEAFSLAGGESVSGPQYVAQWGRPPYFRQLGGDPSQETLLSDPPGTPTGSARTWPLDRAFVPSGQCEFAGFRLTVHVDTDPYAKDKASFATSLSDHLLVSVPIRIMPDDDDGFSKP